MLRAVCVLSPPMKRPPEPKPIQLHEIAVALLAAALLWLCLAWLVVWIDQWREKDLEDVTTDTSEEFISEFRVDEPPQDKDEDEDDELSEVSTADTPDDRDDAIDVETPEEDPTPRAEAPAEPETVPEPVPETVVVIQEDRLKRQSVDQPTTNAEVPETDDYYLAEVDNMAEEETMAEDATTEYDDSAPVDARAHESESTEAPSVPEPTQDQAPTQATTPREQSDHERDDPQDISAEGVPDAEPGETEESEAGPKESKDQKAEEKGDRLEETTTSPIAEADKGPVRRERETQSAEAFGRASGLGSKMQEAAKRSEEHGRGEQSVTRKGVAYAQEHYDEVLGKRTEEYQRRAEQTRKEDSLLGDHAGDWQRTREAMENYDIAVTAGSETMLNTRRDDHAPFINAYHAKIHDEWWAVVALIDRKYDSVQTSIRNSMATTLEIRVLSDGTIDNVAVISTSGDTFMDAEAIRMNYAVKKAHPPSSKILCDDNSVYLHWQFSRGPSRCSTQGASLHCPK